jgi:hypothetical protein
VDKLIDKLNTANNKVNCKIFGEDGFISNLSIDYAEPQNTTLDKLVGKWAVRTKPVIKNNGYRYDTSWMKYPLFVLELTSEGIKFKDDHLGYEDFLYYENNIDRLFLDNNWIEYKPERKD